MKRISENSYVFPDRVGDLVCKEKTLTQQHFAEDVDVNNIVARAIKTGFLGDPNRISMRQAIFADFTGFDGYHNSMNKVIAAQNAFLELPVEVRSRFDNDPGKLIEFLADVKNKEEAIELGLIAKEPVKEPVKPAEPAKPAA